MSTQVGEYKLEGETLLVDFDFLSRLIEGETVVTAAVNCTVYAGVDALPASMLSGTSTVLNNVVSQLITGGTVGVIYLLTASARTSLNNILINESKLAVLTSNALVPAELP